MSTKNSTRKRIAIKVSDIERAEKILGIKYSKTERMQMVNNLEGQIISAKLRREIDLDNSVPMATKFDPRLPGFSMPADMGYISSDIDYKLPHKEEDIAFATIVQQAHLIKKGLITSRKLTEKSI